jgi:hypothetical protein
MGIPPLHFDWLSLIILKCFQLKIKFSGNSTITFRLPFPDNFQLFLFKKFILHNSWVCTWINYFQNLYLQIVYRFLLLESHNYFLQLSCLYQGLLLKMQ